LGDAPPARASRPAPSRPASLPPLDASALSRAETELARYVGAVARVLVKRAAAQARSEPELYQLLAGHVDDPAERTAFVRKGLSLSGRPS
jgi:serine/threonine-protein kinase